MLWGALETIGLIVLAAMGSGVLVLVAAPFRLSGLISQRERDEEFRILCGRLQKLTNENAANDAEHQESPVRLVRP